MAERRLEHHLSEISHDWPPGQYLAVRNLLMVARAIAAEDLRLGLHSLPARRLIRALAACDALVAKP